MNKITHIIVHCSGTKDGKVADWPAIKRYHKEVNGWKDVGYHFGFENVNGELTTFCGRPINIQGAHCNAGNMNPTSIGVCFVGDFDKEAPSPDLLRYGAKYIAGLCKFLKVPMENVRPHREFESKKTCPGRQFDMIILRGFVSSFLSE